MKPTRTVLLAAAVLPTLAGHADASQPRWPQIGGGPAHTSALHHALPITAENVGSLTFA